MVLGTFSMVYKAVSLGQKSKTVALKRIRQTSAPSRIERELRFLMEVGGKEHVRLVYSGYSWWIMCSWRWLPCSADFAIATK